MVIDVEKKIASNELVSGISRQLERIILYTLLRRAPPWRPERPDPTLLQVSNAGVRCCWSRSAFDIRIGQQSSTVKDGKYIHTLITHSIDEAVVALENFANFFASEFSNDLAGEREGAQTFDRSPQAANVGRRSLWSVSCDEISNSA